MSQKRKLILREGTDVDIVNNDGVVIQTKSLIGRATSQFSTPIALENERKGHFLPESKIDNGYIVINRVTGETHLTIAVYAEMFKGNILSNAVHMYKCNSVMTVGGLKSVADNRGNIRREFVSKYENKPIYLQQVSASLRQYDPGLHQDTEFIIFSSKVDVDALDTITLEDGSKLKVIACNNFVFKGVSRIQVKSETR